MAEPVVGAAGGTVDGATEQAIASARSGGKPLDAPLRRSMEAAIGADFGRIRLHVGPQADALNEQVHARAFTTGSDVFVRRQDYSPGTADGQRLLAHELTHTVQQGAAPSLGAPAVDGDEHTVRRMPLLGLVQREGEEGDEEDDEEGDVAEVDISEITGESGPAALESEFKEALKAANTAVAELPKLPVSNSSQINTAKKAVATAQGLVDEVERLVEVVETRTQQAEKLWEDYDEGNAEAFDEILGYEKLAPMFKSNCHKLSESFAEASGQIGLAEETVNQGAAQAQKLANLRGKWASAALAVGHYQKHKGDTGAANEEEYLTRADALNKQPAGGKIKRKTRKDGDILTMNTATKEFTILSTAGKIRTFFCPSGGIKYFNKQE